MLSNIHMHDGFLHSHMSENDIKKSQDALDKAYGEYKGLLDNTYPIISYFEMGNIVYFYR